MKNSHFVLIVIGALTSLIALTTDLKAQGQRITSIELTQRAESNAFTITEDRSKTYLRAVNVMDPATGKLLELIREVEIRRRQSGESVKKPMRFQRGNAGPLLIPYNPDDDMVVTVLVVNRLKVVPLVKDAESNAYETTLIGTQFDLKARNVRDPETDKVLKAIEEIRIKCLQDDPPVIRSVPFVNGNSSTTIRIRCAAPYSAEVFILD